MSKMICLSSGKGSALKKRICSPFRKRLDVEDSKQEVTKVVSFVKMEENLPSV